MIRAVSILMIILLSSCATGVDISSQKIRKKIVQINILSYDNIEKKKHKVIKTIKVSFCTSNAANLNHSDKSAAITNLKFMAYELGADALSPVLCHSTGFDFLNNCWNSTECYSDAIGY